MTGSPPPAGALAQRPFATPQAATAAVIDTPAALAAAGRRGGVP